MGRELRHHRRYEVSDVRGSLLVSLDARILNMSLTGMAIETRSLLKVGGSYFLRLPQEGGGQLRFKTDVMWCRLVRNERSSTGEVTAIYQAGLDFRNGLDENARKVLEFLETHMVVELDRRVTGRLQMAESRPASISVRHEFEVRRLSLGGAMVETVWEPPINTPIDLEIDTGKGVVRAFGRVRDVLPAVGDPDGPPVYCVGIQFVGLDADGQRPLASFLESLLE